MVFIQNKVPLPSVVCLEGPRDAPVETDDTRPKF